MLERWLRNWLNSRHTEEEAFKQRSEQLLARGKEFRLSEILEHIKADILGYKDGEGIPAAQAIRWTRVDEIKYGVSGVGLKDPKFKHRNREPVVSAEIYQSVDGRIMLRGEERSHPWVQLYDVYSLELTEGGVFLGTPREGKQVIFGTTALIRNHADLRKAVDRTLGYSRRPSRSRLKES